MVRIIILGSGGHGQVIADAIHAQQKCGVAREVVGFLDDNRRRHGADVLGTAVLGNFSELANFEHDAVVIGIGTNQVRSCLYAELRARGERFATIVHPRAVIADDARIGEGTVVFAGAVVNTGTVIGCNCIINTAASVDHHCRIMDHVHIAPGAHTGGTVVVGKGSLLGIGSSVLPNKSIGDWVTVGASSAVITDIPDGFTVCGVPARALTVRT